MEPALSIRHQTILCDSILYSSGFTILTRITYRHGAKSDQLAQKCDKQKKGPSNEGPLSILWDIPWSLHEASCIVGLHASGFSLRFLHRLL